MRSPLLLGVTVFCAGSVATFEPARTTAEPPGQETVELSTGSLGGATDTARMIMAELSSDEMPVPPGYLPSSRIDGRIAAGEILPDSVRLHFIPKHETYRYAVVNDRWVIVDAASRRIVYIIR
ncbi:MULTISPECIES: DUF1236 domain-containing protein [Microvirga]|uniref:DUF1236 domain-containing protein n=1 Tax=Microvirga TaxID=186650 RepID=UPI001CFF70F7|nr:DUF1236 domain-containing protein [Microvirga lenta]MCB5176041.1 DUF1236 domain-containing protein [Microvirga lenta]